MFVYKVLMYSCLITVSNFGLTCSFNDTTLECFKACNFYSPFSMFISTFPKIKSRT